jgi:hypothetical protein
LPSACGRFEEARFFAQLLTSFEICEANQDAANWCLGAHLVAYIGINDASEHDFGVIGRQYKEAPLQKEFGLKLSDPNPFFRDPVAINKLYRDLRNIRTHLGERLLEVTTLMQLADIGAGREEVALGVVCRPLRNRNRFANGKVQKSAIENCREQALPDHRPAARHQDRHHRRPQALLGDLCRT